MRVYGASRNELFARVEKSALLPLPQDRFTYAEWKAVRVSRLDYHVEVDGHFYSAPHTMVAEEAKMEARITATTVELYRNGERFTSHLRSQARGRHTTKPEHMPKAHQKHLEWTPARIAHWAASIGPKTKELVEAILADRPHPEMGYRSCLGILRLGKKYPDRRQGLAREPRLRHRAGREQFLERELPTQVAIPHAPDAAQSSACVLLEELVSLTRPQRQLRPRRVQGDRPGWDWPHRPWATRRDRLSGS